MDVLVRGVKMHHGIFTRNVGCYSEFNLAVVTLKEHMSRWAAEDTLDKLISRYLLKIDTSILLSAGDFILVTLA